MLSDRGNAGGNGENRKGSGGRVSASYNAEGNRRQPTFFVDDDYRTYMELMAEWCRRCNVEVWAYCLMPNHTHMITVPETEEGLRRAIGEAHRRYTRHVNFREGWKGHLWQGRFASFPMDESHLLAAALRVLRRNWRKVLGEYLNRQKQAGRNFRNEYGVPGNGLIQQDELIRGKVLMKRASAVCIR